MKLDYKQLVSPENINTVSGLALIAKVVVDGFLSGRHNSRRVAQGLEFSQYRAYQAGDDMRLLDWKMLARSGRYYIKQSEIDTHVTIKFVIDASASMQYQENGISKLDYAKILVASLALLGQNQGDNVGLYTLNDRGLKSLFPATHKQHYNRLLLELVNLEAMGSWPKDLNSIQKVQRSSARELLFFITDMYEDQDELSTWIKKLKTVRNELVVLNLCGTKELDFDYQGALIFEDLESGQKVKVDAKAAKETYVTAVQNHLKETKNTFLAKGIGYDLFRFDAPLSDALQLFLKKRIRLS